MSSEPSGGETEVKSAPIRKGQLANVVQQLASSQNGYKNEYDVSQHFVKSFIFHSVICILLTLLVTSNVWKYKTHEGCLYTCHTTMAIKSQITERYTQRCVSNFGSNVFKHGFKLKG